MENYTKEKFLKLLRKIDFPNYTTFTCLNKAYLDFIFTGLSDIKYVRWSYNQ